MTETKTSKDENKEERYSIDANIEGAYAASIAKKEPELAIEVMKKYLNPSDPINALGFVMAYRDGFDKSPIGERAKKVDTPKYEAALQQRTLAEILDSRLGKGLEASLKDEILAKDGNQKYKNVLEKINEYSVREQALKSAYEEEIMKAEKDKDEKKVEELKEQAEKELKELQEQYDAERLQRVQSVVMANQEVAFADIRRNVVLKGLYKPGFSLKEIVEASQADYPADERE
jgi:hypothetical protein